MWRGLEKQGGDRGRVYPCWLVWIYREWNNRSDDVLQVNDSCLLLGS